MSVPEGSPWIDRTLGTYGPFTLTVRCGRNSTDSCDGIPYGGNSDFIEICARSSVDWVAADHRSHAPSDKELLQFGSRATGATSPFWKSFTTDFEPLLTRDPNVPDYVAVSAEAVGLAVQGHDCVISGSVVHLPGPTN